MPKYKLYIFDADETLRKAINTKRPYPISDEQWILGDNVLEVISNYEWKNNKSDGLYYGIVSNQPGISRGEITNEDAFDLLLKMFESAFNFKPDINVVKFCPHQHNDRCECRKPKIKLFQEIASYWAVDTSQILFIGDRKTDEEAAKNFGCDFKFSSDFFSHKNPTNI